MGNKTRYLVTVIWSLIFFSSIQILSFADGPVVDIGLFFGNNSQYPAGISSDDGFTFILEEEGISSVEIDLSNYKALKVYKAGFYQNEALVTGSQTYYDNGNVKGAFAILLGETQADFDRIFESFLQYKALDAEVSLYYDGLWGITYGNYMTQDLANSAITSVSSLFSDQTLKTIRLPRGQMIAYGDGHPLISFDTQVGDGVFSAPLINFNEGVYREGILFKRLPDSDYSVINHLNIDSYLYGVLPKEMSTTWPIEALKAQAIAARNYTLINIDKHSAMGFDLCNTTDCQVYGGYGVEGEISNLAVDSTKGLILTYEGDLVSCYYHSNSGGETEDVSNIWSGDLPYIKGVLDPYSIGQPNDTWTLTLTASQIQSALANSGFNIGTYQSVEVNSVSNHGRVTKITFKGTSGTASLLKEQMRSIFGYTSVRSMYFTLDPPVETLVYMHTANGISSISPTSLSVMTANGLASVTTDSYVAQSTQVVVLSDSFESSTTIQSNTSGLTLYGKGYGHGLGMSQWGAKAMADLGYTYDAILKHYYTNTLISDLSP